MITRGPRTHPVARRMIAFAMLFSAALCGATVVPVGAANAKSVVAGHWCGTLGTTSRSATGPRLDCVQEKTNLLWEPEGQPLEPVTEQRRPAAHGTSAGPRIPDTLGLGCPQPDAARLGR